MVSIDLFCTIGSGVDEYVSFFKKTCDLLESKKHNINYYCLGMEGCDEPPPGFKYIRSKRQKHSHDSMKHALCVHEAFEKIESQYVVFADIDIAILQKNWDDIIIKILDSGYACTGFQYRHHFFPGVIFFACKKSLVDEGLVDFKPKMDRRNRRIRYKIKDKKEARLFGKRIGATIICDSGWRLPLLINSAGYKSKTMNLIYGNSELSQLPFTSEEEKQRSLEGREYRRGAEFHLDNNIFGTHFKDCRNIKFNDDRSIIWRKRVAKLLFEKYNIKM